MNKKTITMMNYIISKEKSEAQRRAAARRGLHTQPKSQMQKKKIETKEELLIFGCYRDYLEANPYIPRTSLSMQHYKSIVSGLLEKGSPPQRVYDFLCVGVAAG